MPIHEGDKALGVEGTFRLNDIVYVVTPEADDLLLQMLTLHDYWVEEGTSAHYTAEKRYTANQKEEFLERHWLDAAQPFDFGDQRGDVRGRVRDELGVAVLRAGL